MPPTRPIRICDRNDYEALAEVMYDAVRNGPSAYSEQQRRAWVPEVRHGPVWEERLSAQTVFAAEDHERIVGFMSLAAQGYIDFAYIRPSSQGKGLFRRLYHELETVARQSGERRLWVHASPIAQPAFSAVGFEILKEETVEIRDQAFRRFEMQKHLS